MKALNRDNIIYSTPMEDWAPAVDRLLSAASFPIILTGYSSLLLKPNLVEAVLPPVTTPVGLVESLVVWLRRAKPELKIFIGEGTGSINYDTTHCFRTLGYTEMAARQKVELIDLNRLPATPRKKPECRRWPEIYLPELLDHVFLFSVPVLKAHSLAGVTLSMKNMMGCAPPAHYQAGNSWRKSAFHSRIQEAIFDLNRYRPPDFTLLDATVGMSQAHLWGPHCQPPPGLLAASADPVAIDSYGCSLLGRSWREVGHIAMADGVLGCAEPLEICHL